MRVVWLLLAALGYWLAVLSALDLVLGAHWSWWTAGILVWDGGYLYVTRPLIFGVDTSYDIY